MIYYFFLLTLDRKSKRGGQDACKVSANYVLSDVSFRADVFVDEFASYWCLLCVCACVRLRLSEMTPSLDLSKTRIKIDKSEKRIRARIYRASNNSSIVWTLNSENMQICTQTRARAHTRMQVRTVIRVD